MSACFSTTSMTSSNSKEERALELLKGKMVTMEAYIHQLTTQRDNAAAIAAVARKPFARANAKLATIVNTRGQSKARQAADVARLTPRVAALRAAWAPHNARLEVCQDKLDKAVATLDRLRAKQENIKEKIAAAAAAAAAAKAEEEEADASCSDDDFIPASASSYCCATSEDASSDDGTGSCGSRRSSMSGSKLRADAPAFCPKRPSVLRAEAPAFVPVGWAAIVAQFTGC